MRPLLSIMALLVLTTAAEGQVVMATSRGVTVAHDGIIELFDGAERRWSSEGLQNASAIVAGRDHIAVLDAWSSRVRIVMLADGRGRTFPTGATPIGGVFLGEDLYLLERDSRSLTRFSAGGATESIRVSADPAFIGTSAGRLYVYSRLAGTLEEIVPGTQLTVVRKLAIPPFAADMKISDGTAYLVFPRDARLLAINLEKLDVRSAVDAGGAPVSLAVAGRPTALSPARIAIADPAAKRVWVAEGAQSVGAAFGRGFLRGLIGLGLFRPRSSAFPTGVDFVLSASGVTVAFDSSSGTLYRVEGTESHVLAENLPPQAFTVAGDRIAIWRGGSLRFIP